MNADLVVAGGEFVNKEDQAAGARHKLLVGRSLDPLHCPLVDLPRQDTPLEQLVGRVEV